MLILAVAGFVIVPERQPHLVTIPGGPTFNSGPATQLEGSRTLYDALRIATWALLIVGAVLLIVGLINYARAGAARSART